MLIRSLFKCMTTASLLLTVTQAWSTPAASCQPIKSGAIHDVIIKAETTAPNCFEVIFETPPKSIDFGVFSFLAPSPPLGLRLQTLRASNSGNLETEHELLTDSDGNIASNIAGGARNTFFAIQPIQANGSHYKVSISAHTLEGVTVVLAIVEERSK